MDTITVSRVEDYAVVTLTRGKANPINMQMVDELRQALGELAEDEAVRGVILTGREGCFSAGLDVVELYGYDEAGFEQFWRGFTGLGGDLLMFPKPLVCAISGHSPAGGCILALCCDYRVMAEGKYRIGLNELAVGLVVPEPVILLLGNLTGPEKAYQMVLDAAMLKPERALEAGVVNEVCPMEEVMGRAVKRLKGWLAFDDTAWRKTKQNLRRPLVEAYDGDWEKLHRETLRHWWTPECRATVGRVIKMLGK